MAAARGSRRRPPPAPPPTGPTLTTSCPQILAATGAEPQAVGKL